MERIRSYAIKCRRSYIVYAAGCAVAWAIVLGILDATETSHRMGFVWCVFGGWIIGWVSATIARFVYPPPARWLPKENDGRPTH